MHGLEICVSDSILMVSLNMFFPMFDIISKTFMVGMSPNLKPNALMNREKCQLTEQKLIGKF